MGSILWLVSIPSIRWGHLLYYPLSSTNPNDPDAAKPKPVHQLNTRVPDYGMITDGSLRSPPLLV